MKLVGAALGRRGTLVRARFAPGSASSGELLVVLVAVHVPTIKLAKVVAKAIIVFELSRIMVPPFKDNIT
jgi:hypothetical protein